jgi:hypothetical protein
LLGRIRGDARGVRGEPKAVGGCAAAASPRDGDAGGGAREGEAAELVHLRAAAAPARAENEREMEPWEPGRPSASAAAADAAADDDAPLLLLTVANRLQRGGVLTGPLAAAGGRGTRAPG